MCYLKTGEWNAGSRRCIYLRPCGYRAASDPVVMRRSRQTHYISCRTAPNFHAGCGACCNEAVPVGQQRPPRRPGDNLMPSLSNEWRSEKWPETRWERGA